MGPERFEFMARFSDWLRLALLAKHGGVWLDATLLLTAPLQYLVNESATFSGVHLEDREDFLWAKNHGEYRCLLLIFVGLLGLSWAYGIHFFCISSEKEVI